MDRILVMPVHTHHWNLCILHLGEMTRKLICADYIRNSHPLAPSKNKYLLECFSALSLSLSLNATYRHLSRSDSAQCAIRALSIEGEGSLARIAEHSTSNQHIQHTKCSTIGISGRVCDLSHTYTP